MKTFGICLLCIVGALADLDPRFSVDPREFLLNEMSENIRQISGTIMGIAEFVVEIKNDVKNVQKEMEVQNRKNSIRSLFRNEVNASDSQNNRVNKDAILADKMEQLLAIENNTQVEAAKDKIEKIMEVNFIRFLSALLVTGPKMTPEKTEDILRLMKAVLTGEVDFSPVVHKLPFIMRDSETNQIILMMQTLYENEAPRNFRQVSTQMQTQTQPGQVQAVRVTMKPQTGLEKILQAMSQLNVEQVAGLLQYLPSFFEGIGTIVDGVSDLD